MQLYKTYTYKMIDILIRRRYRMNSGPNVIVVEEVPVLEYEKLFGRRFVLYHKRLCP